MKTLNTGLLFHGGQQVSSLVWLMKDLVQIVNEFLNRCGDRHVAWSNLNNRIKLNRPMHATEVSVLSKLTISKDCNSSHTHTSQ